MTSLLGSIFGGSSEDKETNRNLFTNSNSLPQRPHHISKASDFPKHCNRDEVSLNKETVSDIDISNGSNTTESSRRQRMKNDRKLISRNADDGDKTDNEKSEETSAKVTGENRLLKNSNDEERTIFVGNLPLTTTRKKLAALFRVCGPIASSRIRSVPVAGIKLPKDQAGNQRMMRKVCVNTNQIDGNLTDFVQGYVVFKNLNDLEKALELNNKLEVDGMKIRVDRARPTIDPLRSVFVGNLPYASKESTLQEHFERGCFLEPGEVMGVRIVRSKETFKCKGFGYVLFRQRNTVPTALKLNDSTYMKQKIRVMVCGKRLKGRKGKASQTKQKCQRTEKMSVGAFRRIIAKQQKDSSVTIKRKRGEKNKNIAVTKAGTGGLSKRALLDKKIKKKVKQLEKRVARGMGKNKS